ncbi:MAG: glycine betaine/L-proline ABC transporter ATP-binding protein [Euzebyales bacterium]|nr:glycine betaine/L-proline ABC transporter ATP-binding protein [Euzebyales bacterium]MBA3621078.1 glycine betaine/L-proline ABC transporter ATP-binding protein [Euzebyales bacterium]
MTTMQTDRQTKVACQGLWKVFGPRAERIIGSEHARLPRDQMRSATGCVAAVRDVSFDVTRGEIFVVMGLSGSGKSTLIRCLSRLIEPTAGSVTIDGVDILAMPPRQLRELRRHQVSMVFQHFGLLPNRRVLDNVAYGLEVRGESRQSRYARADELLDVVGLAGLEQAYPDELSGGMQQRVGLARALATEPEVLLFDEPFSALDPLIRRDMQDEVIRLQAAMRKTMIFITHDLSEALKLGDRIAVMRDGDIVQIGTPQDLVARPADDYVADFTRDVNRARVLTARWIMSATPGGDDSPGAAGDDGPTAPADTVVHELIPLVAGDGRPVRILDGERVIGTVDRDAVMAAVYGKSGNGHR